MKNIKARTAILASAIMAFHCSFAQTQVSAFSPGLTANGVNYVLPKTGLKVQVVATKTTYTPGEVSRYAERYLHLNDVKQETETTWEIKEMQVSQYGTPDKDKTFTIKLKDKTVAPMARLTQSGILVAINADNEWDEKELSVPADVVNTVNPKNYLTEEILSATSTAKMAELTANEIYDIRESINAITRGQAENMPQDGASLKIVLDQLKAQEAGLMQLFQGTTTQTSTKATFTLEPEGDVKDQVMFRFSRRLGIVDADDLSGEPVYISVTDKKTVPLPTEEEKGKRKITGVVYNQPSDAVVVMNMGGREIYRNTLPFAQFGTIDVLMPALFNKGATTKVLFNPATGGIEKIE